MTIKKIPDSFWQRGDELESHWKQAAAEFGRSVHVSEHYGGYKIERFADGRTRQYYGISFNEAMQNARAGVEMN